MSRGLQEKLNALLRQLADEAGYSVALVCTDEGLLVASADDDLDSEELAGLTGLFDDIVTRAQRDLSMQRVDEVTMLDPGRGRLVVRPLAMQGPQRFFLVVRVPHRSTWRRNTNRLGRALVDLLGPMAAEA